jgi:cytochrome P450
VTLTRRLTRLTFDTDVLAADLDRVDRFRYSSVYSEFTCGSWKGSALCNGTGSIYDTRIVDYDGPFQLTEHGRQMPYMYAYADSLRDYRLCNPGDDLISLLVHADASGSGITDEEFKNFFFLFAVAGNDTTRSALPGGLPALLDHPDQLAKLRDEPHCASTAVDECLRYAPPVIHFRRTAAEDTRLRGARIRAADKVVGFYPSANRDPEAIPDPDRFDITRQPNRHVCVAAALACMQLRHTFTAVVERIPGLTITGPVERLASNFLAGVKRIPVTLG